MKTNLICKPETKGWTKIARNEHRHDASMVVLKKNVMTLRWEVVGGVTDGESLSPRLWIAQASLVRGW